MPLVALASAGKTSPWGGIEVGSPRASGTRVLLSGLAVVS